MCTRLMHGQTKGRKERSSKEGISRVKFKIFNPPSINRRVGMGTRLALYISGEGGVEEGTGMVNCWEGAVSIQ